MNWVHWQDIMVLGKRFFLLKHTMIVFFRRDYNLWVDQSDMR